jgi:hypothetical protein
LVQLNPFGLDLSETTITLSFAPVSGVVRALTTVASIIPTVSEQ